MSDHPSGRDKDTRPAKEPRKTRLKGRQAGQPEPPSHSASSPEPLPKQEPHHPPKTADATALQSEKDAPELQEPQNPPGQEEKRENPGPVPQSGNPPPPAPESPARPAAEAGAPSQREPARQITRRPSHLERVAAVLPPEHRQQWAILASRLNAASSDNNDEFYLLTELIAFSGLLTSNANQAQEELAKSHLAAQSALTREAAALTQKAAADIEKALAPLKDTSRFNPSAAVDECLAGIRKSVAENLSKSIALPDIKDFREMSHRLTKDMDMLRAVIDKLSAKTGTRPAADPAAAPVEYLAGGHGTGDLDGIKRALFTCVFLLLAGAGGLGFWIWHEAGKARADITSRVSEHELSWELAGTGGGLQLRDGVNPQTKEDVRELVIDGGFLKVKAAFLTEDGKGVIHLDPRMAPGKKSMFSP